MPIYLRIIFIFFLSSIRNINTINLFVSSHVSVGLSLNAMYQTKMKIAENGTHNFFKLLIDFPRNNNSASLFEKQQKGTVIFIQKTQ